MKKQGKSKTQAINQEAILIKDYLFLLKKYAPAARQKKAGIIALYQERSTWPHLFQERYPSRSIQNQKYPICGRNTPSNSRTDS